LPLPLVALQIIAVDLGFEIFVAMSYAWEVPESRKKGVMMQL
jgi:sodium/potassium-transporting ATPase subunit alpha